jgi:putative membrane protein
MKISKKLAIIATLLISTTPLFAKTDAVKVTSAEKGSLATIAALDKSEILLSVVAVNKKPSSEVADYAKMMIEMHGSNLTQILEMANSLKALPLDGGAAAKVQKQTMDAMIKLGGLSEPQFDKAYIDDMVKGHQAALDMIDHQLLKTAKSEEIKKFITDTRAVVVQHLEDAKKIQENLK